MQIIADTGPFLLCNDENLFLQHLPLFHGPAQLRIRALQIARALLDPLVQLVVRAPQLLFGLVLLGRVASYFRETAQRACFLVIEPSHHAIDPDAHAILADMPAPIAGDAVTQCRLDLLFLRLVLAIFRREHDFPGLAHGFASTPAEYTLRTGAPIHDLVARGHHENGIITRAIDHQSIAFFAFLPSLFSLFQILDIRGRSNPGNDAILIAQRHSPSNKPVILSGSVTQPVLALKYFASLECALPSLLRNRFVVGMNKCLPDQSGRSLGIQPGILVPAAIKIIRVSVSVVCPDDLRNRIEQPAHRSVSFAQRLVHCVQLGCGD